MSLRRASSINTSSRASPVSRNASNSMQATMTPSSARLNQSCISGEPGVGSDAELKSLRLQLHQTEMENQRLRLELQRRPTQKEYSEQKEEMEKVETLFARGSQENEKLMLRMKEKEDREKELERALCRMLGQDWANQLGVSQTSATMPAMDFESTPLPAARSFRAAGQTSAYSMQTSQVSTSPGTPIAQIARSRNRFPSQSFSMRADGEEDQPSEGAGFTPKDALSSGETQQLLRLLLDPPAKQISTSTAPKLAPELIASFARQLSQCKEQLLEQERKGSAREARIRGLLKEVYLMQSAEEH